MLVVVILSCAVLALIGLNYIFETARKDVKIRQLGSRAPALFTSPWSIIKVYRKVIQAVNDDTLKDLYEGLYGDRHVIEAQMTPGTRTIHTREPEHIKALLATQFADFGKGEKFHKLWSPFLGDGIFTTDGQLWSTSRSLIRPMFNVERVSDLDIFERGIQHMMSKFPSPGTTFDIQDLFFRLTLDTSTEFLLGTSVNSLDDPGNGFSAAFDAAQREQMKISMMSPFDFFLDKKPYYKHIREVEDYILPLIEQTLALRPEQLDQMTKSDNNFTFLHNMAKMTRDPKVIRDQLIAVLLAGRDTTAATLSWCLYELAGHPDKYRRLRAEVLDEVGDTAAPTYKMLKGMKYLRYTIQETLRLYPAVPLNVKACLQDTVLPAVPGQAAIGVCKGDLVVWGPMLSQLRPDLYPPATEHLAGPEEFSPERWYVWQPKPWEYVPFNGGPRVCPGQNFANTEIAHCLVRILQKYESIEYRGDWAAQLRKCDIVARPKFGVPIALSTGM